MQGNHITSEAQATQIVSQIRFSGLTPLGTSLDQKVLQPMLLNPARAGQLRKPLLVIVISDGAPAGKPRNRKSLFVLKLTVSDLQENPLMLVSRDMAWVERRFTNECAA